MTRIEITISPKGETTIQTIGFSGADCRQASQYLEAALGTIVRDLATAEFHQTHTANQLRQDTR